MTDDERRTTPERDLPSVPLKPSDDLALATAVGITVIAFVAGLAGWVWHLIDSLNPAPATAIREGVSESDPDAV